MRLVPIGGRAADHRKAGRPVRALAGLTALMAGLLTVAGCQAGSSSSSSATPTFSGGDNVVRVAQTPGVGDAPLFLAFQQGLFRKAGLQVRITNYATTRAELTALRAGKVDVAFGDYADMFYAQAQAQTQTKGSNAKGSLNLVIVADGYDAVANTMEVLTLPGQGGAGIVTPQDLAGKSVGTAQAQLMPSNVAGHPYSLDTVATQSVLNNDSVKPTSITWKPLPPEGPQGLIQSLANHQVDAILATEPTIFEAESQLGAVPVLDSCTGFTANLPLFGYFSSRTFATAHRATLTAFRNVLLKAQALANSQSAPVRNTLEGSEGMSVQDASLLTIGQYPTTVSVNDLQRVISLMFSFNAIPAQPSVKAMIFH